MHNAFTKSFPELKIRGCFFHLQQSIWRKIQSAGLQANYQNDEEYALMLKLLPSIAFVPSHKVLDEFNKLVSTVDFPEEMLPVVDYFESTYTLEDRIEKEKLYLKSMYGIVLIQFKMTYQKPITVLKGGTKVFPRWLVPTSLSGNLSNFSERKIQKIS